jgi:hypothetical protein
MKEKLIKGQIFKNYNKVCEWLSVKPTRGKGRQYHIREFERYCTYYKDKNKYIVDEVYEFPLDKIDNRGGNHNFYDTLMDDLIIKMLKNNDGVIEDTYSKIFCEHIQLLKNDYKYINKIDNEKIADTIDSTAGLVNVYKYKQRDVIVKCFETALNRLQRNNIIKWDKCKKVIEKRTPIIVNSNEKLFMQIVEEENKILAKLNTSKFLLCKNPAEADKLINEVSENLNIKNYWTIYQIILIKDVEYPTTDIEELKKLFIIRVHEIVSNKEYSNEFGEKFKPYLHDSYTKPIIHLDNKFWNDADKLYDDVNKIFESAYYNYKHPIKIIQEDEEEYPFLIAN